MHSSRGRADLPRVYSGCSHFASTPPESRPLGYAWQARIDGAAARPRGWPTPLERTGNDIFYKLYLISLMYYYRRTPPTPPAHPPSNAAPSSAPLAMAIDLEQTVPRAVSYGLSNGQGGGISRGRKKVRRRTSAVCHSAFPA